MQILSLVGWLIIGVSIAVAICSRDAKSQTSRNSPFESKEVFYPTNETWCETIELLYTVAILLFDDSLHLIATGANGRKILPLKDDTPIHLIDLVPRHLVQQFLSSASRARRGEKVYWENLWHGQMTKIVAAPVGVGHILISVDLKKDKT